MNDYELAVGNDVVNSKRHSHQKVTESKAKKKLTAFRLLALKIIWSWLLLFIFILPIKDGIESEWNGSWNEKNNCFGGLCFQLETKMIFDGGWFVYFWLKYRTIHRTKHCKMWNFKILQLIGENLL